MNKKELIEAIVEKTELSKKDAGNALDGFIDVVTECLEKDEKVQLVGFGSFAITHRASRKGINPRTGEEIVVPAIKSPVFKAGKKLKDTVNGR